MMRQLGFCAIAAIVGLSNANAGVVALSWSGGGSQGFSQLTRGWAFDTSTAINVSALGWYDNASNGLIDSHQVGIWNAAGTLLMTATVGAGTADTLLNGFRYNTGLSGATALTPGRYVVAGLSTSSDATWRLVPLAAVTMGAGISYVEDRFSNASGVFSFANAHQGADVGYFGPNFQFDAAPSAVPEPGALALSMLGLGLLGLQRRRRSRKA